MHFIIGILKRILFIPLVLVIVVQSCSAVQPSDPDWEKTVLSYEDAKSAADAGDAYAQAVISIYYGIGWKTDKNPQQSLQYAANSAKGGSPLGLYRLGSILRNGEGIAKNESQGFELQKRALQGMQDMGDNPYALSALGVILFQGKIVTEDKAGSAILYKKASSLGYAPAALNLARWPERAPGEPSKQERIELLKQAAYAGLQTAEKLLAEKGISVSEEKASNFPREELQIKPESGRDDQEHVNTVIQLPVGEVDAVYRDDRWCVVCSGQNLKVYDRKTGLLFKELRNAPQSPRRILISEKAGVLVAFMWGGRHGDYMAIWDLLGIDQNPIYQEGIVLSRGQLYDKEKTNIAYVSNALNQNTKKLYLSRSILGLKYSISEINNIENLKTLTDNIKIKEWDQKVA